ncbi:MAG: AraC family transcriptional regulator [Myxococcales bacterium]|nr:AraC family transcriptional regulator [Myxococcales bacterium]
MSEIGLKTELVLPAPTSSRPRDRLATLDSFARRIDESLTESLELEDVVRAVARLSVPELADHCAVDVIEGDKSVRCVFAHRDPRKMEAAGRLMEEKAQLSDFAEGRRALAGEPVLFQFSADTFTPPALQTPAMIELVRIIEPRSAIFLPFVVLGTTIAIAAFVRTAVSDLVHGREDLALAQELARRAVIRHAGFRAPRFTSTEDSRLRRVDDFIRDNIGSAFSLKALAREAGLSRFHFLRLFKQTYGETPFKRVTRLRMEAAQRRLARSRESVTEIASACGYENAAHFASAFRRMFGVSPMAFRRLVR